MAYINKINVDGVEYEVQDKNALPSADLPEAINMALAQAKESGEFDGPQGPAGNDYTLTEADKQEIAELAADIVPGGGADVPEDLIVTNNGDTLTWDGNTDGLVFSDAFGEPMYKVSDAVLTAADFANGFAYTVNYDTVNTNDSVVDDNQGLCTLGTSDGNILMCSGNSDAFSTVDVDLPSGTYFVTRAFATGMPAAHITSLTINGYTGFASTTINPKYLPDDVGGGVEEVYVGTDTPPDGTKVWINPKGVATFPLPTANDAGKVLKAKGANEAEWGEAPSGGGYKDMTLLAEVDCAELSGGNIKLTGLDNISEFYVTYAGVANDHASTDSGFQLLINNAEAVLLFVPIAKSGATQYGWSYARYNGKAWVIVKSAPYASINYKFAQSGTQFPYYLREDTGRATSIELVAPLAAYSAKTGTIKIYGR